MKKTIVYIAGLLILPVLALASGGAGFNFFQPPSKTYLVRDRFNGTDGSNLYAHAPDTGTGWTGDNTAEHIIDDGDVITPKYGVGCLHMDLPYNASPQKTNTVTFSEQTSGKITLDFWLYPPELDTDTHINVMGIMDGGSGWNAADMYTYLLFRNNSGSHEYRLFSAPGVYTVVETGSDYGQWVHIEIELDLDNDLADVWIDGVSVDTDVPVDGTTGSDPDSIIIQGYTGDADGADVGMDDLELYEGARQ